jgi:hypothetical protein
VNTTGLPRLAVALAVAAQVALVWQVRSLPTQDGPAHHYSSALGLMLGSREGAPDIPVIAAHFEPRPTLASKAPQLALGLLERAVGARAEAVFVTLYFVLFALGSWWIVTGMRRDHGPLAAVAVLLALNYPLYMGFYTFCAGLVAALFAIGLWVRPGHLRVGSLALHALALVLTELGHPLVVAIAVLMSACVSVGRVLAAPGTTATRIRALAVEAAALALATLPAAVLFVAFLSGEGGLTLGLLIPGPGRILQRLTTEPDWVAFSSVEWVPVVIGLLVPVALTAWQALGRWRTRSIDPADGFALAMVAFGVLYVAMPDDIAGGGYVVPRLILSSAIAGALWVATVPREPRERGAVALLAAAATIGLVGIHVPTYRALDALLAEHARAVAVVPHHATLLALSTADLGAEPDRSSPTRRPRPLVHAAGRVDVTTDIALLEHNQATRTHFPLAFRPNAGPYDPGALDTFPFGRLDALARKGGPAAQYVLIWGPIDPARFPGSRLASALETLAREYEPIYTSSDGLARVWRRR